MRWKKDLRPSNGFTQESLEEINAYRETSVNGAYMENLREFLKK